MSKQIFAFVVLSLLMVSSNGVQISSLLDVGIIPPADDSGLIPLGSTKSSNLFLSFIQMSWNEGAEFCANSGMKFVSITSSSMDMAVRGFLAEKRVESAWSSGNDLMINGRFMWQGTGTPFSYTPWGMGMQNPPEKLGCCISMTSSCSSCGTCGGCGNNSKWVGTDCAQKHFVICQF